MFQPSRYLARLTALVDVPKSTGADTGAVDLTGSGDGAEQSQDPETADVHRGGKARRQRSPKKPSKKGKSKGRGHSKRKGKKRRSSRRKTRDSSEEGSESSEGPSVENPSSKVGVCV